MSYETNFLSQSETCAIYQCLAGHIHLKYRSLDITMDPNEFYQVAEVFTDALRALRKIEEPTTDRISLVDIEVLQKV